SWSHAMLFVFNSFVALMLWAFYQSCTTDPGGVPQYWGFHIGDDVKRRRYCKMCHVWKPERCHHCSACNRCNLNMDHHCPWLNNCVGFYNRKFFIQLLVYVYICIALVLLFGFPRVVAVLDDRLNHKAGLLLLHPRNFFGLLAYAVSVLLAFSLFNFVKFHLGLIRDNFTTIENFEREPGVKSKYDIGQRWNVEEVMGSSLWLWWLPLHTKYSKPVGDGVNWRIRTPGGEHRRRSNRRAVRRNLQRRINDYTRCIFLLFCCLLALTLIVLAGVTVWAIFVVEKNDTVCDRPLRTFLLVYFGGVVYAILKSIITRVLLCYNPSTDPEKPLRVKIHDAIFTAFCFAWPIIGVVWLASSDTCSSTAPKLFAVSTAIVVLLIVAWVLTLLGPPILIGILMLAIRRGHIRVAKERQQKVDRVISALRIVSPDQASKVAEECSVCLTEFSETPSTTNADLIRETPCQHYFHHKCLANWAKVGKMSCPLCRSPLDPDDPEEEDLEVGSRAPADSRDDDDDFTITSRAV
ncbi:hypothetical protein FOZ62_000820, partial [Perkinsus olseni]